MQHKNQLLNGESASIKASQLLSEHIYTYKNISANTATNIWGKSTGQTVYTQQDITSRLQHGVHSAALVSSDSLISAIPQLYKLASEKSGVVLHVSAKHGDSSSFADFSNVMAVRQSGLTFLSSSTVQEAHDLAVIAHVVAIKTNTPVLHFFDSKRIAEEFTSIDLIDIDTLNQLISTEDIENYQQQQQQQSEQQSAYLQYKQQQQQQQDGKDVDVYSVVQEAMVHFATLTGRQYSPLEFIGHPEAESVIIAMGAGATVVEKTVNALGKESKLGLLKVRLYRPWSDTDLLAALPNATIKRIAVLEPSHDFTCTWNPLFLDIAAAYQTAEDNDVEIISGQYGVKDQDFSPAQVDAVFAELNKPDFQRKFEVASLKINNALNVVPKEIEQFLIVGDETLALNYAQAAISAGKFAQVYTVNDVSHIRVSPTAGSILPSLVSEAKAVVLQNTSIDAAHAIKALAKDGVVAVHGAAVSESLDVALTEATKRAIGVTNAKVVHLTNVQDLVSAGLSGVLSKAEAMVTPSGWEQLAGTPTATKAATAAEKVIAVETPYLKMLDQVFQDRLEIANAVNSASVWSRDEQNQSASAPEFGYGKIVNKIQQRTRFIDAVEVLIKENKVSEEAYKTLSQWLLVVKSSKSDVKAINKAAEAVLSAVANVSAAEYVVQNKDLLFEKSNWLIGSDTWAYDLGQSGVHHVISQGENVNMLIVDTLPYSSDLAREQRKKDIGLYAMNFGSAYVASVAVYSSYTGVLHALMEADAYQGPSIVLAYLPQESVATTSVNPVFTLKETKISVDNGAWPLYRWNPTLEAEGKEAFSLDSQRIKKDLEKFLERENHFSQIVAQHPDISQLLVSSLENVSI